MPIRDPEARAVALQCVLGPDRAAIAPDSYTLHAFHGDPMGDGVELSDMSEVDDGLGGTILVPNGYTPPTVDADDFAVDDVGISAAAQFADAIAEWSDTATHWALKDPLTGFWWYAEPLIEELDVAEASTGPSLTMTVFFDEEVPGA